MRPWRLEDVVHDLSKNGIVGMTASNVMGVGVQGGAQQLCLTGTDVRSFGGCCARHARY